MTIVIVIIAVIITTSVTMNIYSAKIGNIPEREKLYNTLSQVESVVRSNYYKDIDFYKLKNGAALGYLSELEGNNKILSESEYNNYKLLMSGKNADGSDFISVKSEMYKSVGYIKLLDFTDTTLSQFENAMDSIKSKSPLGVVIDLRDTSSINIDSAARIIDTIVPLATVGTKSIATAVDKDGNNKKVFSADSQSISLPFSVIINEKTEGAGELIACDLRDFGKATIVGKTSAGKGTYCQVFELNDGSAVILSTASLIPYTSDSYDNVGVKPDYEVDGKQNDDLSKDEQFMKAYASVASLQN